MGHSRVCMFQRHMLTLAVAAALAAAVGWVACSARHAAPPARDAGADAGSTGVGGGGGSGAGGGTGATGGAAGAAGSPADGGEWGAAPVWKAIPGAAAGCAFERMVNAAQVRMFKWEPCSWTTGCQQAAWNTGIFGQKANFIRTSTVVDDGASVRVALTMWWEHHMGLVAREDGIGVDAVRVAGDNLDCLVTGTSVWKEHGHMDDRDEIGEAVSPTGRSLPRSHAGVDPHPPLGWRARERRGSVPDALQRPVRKPCLQRRR